MTLPPSRPHRDVPLARPDIVAVEPPLDALAAVNALIAAPWSTNIAARATSEEEAIRQSLEGKTLADASGSWEGFGWEFSLRATGVNVDFDLTTPPGFSSLPQIQPAGSFTLEAPLGGTWHLMLSGMLSAKATIKAPVVGVVASPSDSVAWGLGCDQIKLRATTEFDGSDAAWPKLTRVSIEPGLRVLVTGAMSFEMHAGFDTTIEPGVITLKTRMTNLGFDIGHEFDGKLTADLTITLRPSPTYTVDVAGRPVLTVATIGLHLSLDGHVEFRLPKIGPPQKAAFHLPFDATIPAPDMLSQLLWISGDGLPRDVGRSTDPRGQTKAAPAGIDYAGAARTLETASRQTHMPFGAVFSIQRRHADLVAHGDGGSPSAGRPLAFDQFYAKEEDSSIWTGHFLAAASLRHAATTDPDALTLVGDLLSGIERLFWIAEGDVVKDGQRFPGRTGGFFARSALPDDSEIRWWEADENIAQGRSYYERVEGEIRATASAPDLARHPAEALRPRPGLGTRPSVARTWRGIGCGDRGKKDHPISRDQYAGVFFGLFAAYQFVADDGIRQRTRVLMTRMLDYLLDSGWNVPLPPEGKIYTSYLGAFDHQLAYLRIGKTIAPARFAGHYNRVAAASVAAWLPIWLSVLDPIPEYFKFNLSHAVVSPTLLAEDDPGLRQNYRRAYELLRRASAHHRNAYFNLVRILVELPDQRAAALLIPSGSNPDLNLADEIKGTLAEWLARLEHVKAPTGLPTDKVPDPGALVALWPEAIHYHTLDGGQPYLAPFPMPVDTRIGDGMDFAWERDPFQLGLKAGPNNAAPTKADASLAGDPLREGPAVDYLLAYWLAVYLGVLPGPTAPA
jgi:hypothetical protein